MISIPIFRYEDMEINYIDEGKGAPLVFICGTFTKYQMWNYQIDYFRDKMRVIAFDNRGTGKSSRPDYPYTMDMLVEDTKNLLDHLDINGGVNLCGSSMGAMISMSFTLKYPHMVKTLVLCAPTAYYAPNAYQQNKIVFNNLKELDVESRVKYWFPIMYSRTFKKRLEKEVDLYNKISQDMNFCAQLRDSPTYRDYINQNEALKGFDIRDSLKKIKVPTLILSGDKDRLEVPGVLEFIKERIPNSELKKIPGAGHAFNIEAPTEVNELIWKHLQKHSEN